MSPKSDDESAAPSRLGMPVAAVVIGRNEGGRLTACLESLNKAALPVVYVDSGSTDGSPAAAERMGASVVALDESLSFTAARARNAGVAALVEAGARPDYVQFVDGDCEIAEGWIETARAFLDAHPDVAAVCGRLRERHPERTIYNRLCDIEWDAPSGETTACGGVAMFRLRPFKAAGGFREDLPAGEEPELCLRLREQGFAIHRLDAEMAWHDANMTAFSQWWRRMRRGGRAFAEVSSLHRRSPHRIWRRETWRALAWAALAPVAFVVGIVIHPIAFALLLAYPAQIARIALRRDASASVNWVYGFFMTLAKFAEAQGVIDFWLARTASRAAATDFDSRSFR
ncbi:MAG: glycosyltransferase family 2 protein [Parvularculaceae bacterium]